MLMTISQSQNSSLGDVFEVLEVSLAMLLRKMSEILMCPGFVQRRTLHWHSWQAQEEDRRTVTKEMIEQLRETGMNWRSIANKLHALESPSKHYTDMGSSSGWRTISPISRYCHKLADVWN